MRAYAAGTSRRSKANDAARKSAKLRSGAEKLADRAASEVDRLATDSSLQGGGAGHLVDDRDAQVRLARDDHLRQVPSLEAVPQRIAVLARPHLDPARHVGQRLWGEQAHHARHLEEARGAEVAQVHAQFEVVVQEHAVVPGVLPEEEALGEGVGPGAVGQPNEGEAPGDASVE